jgi:uncharacterized protein (TIGR03382 family)
VGQIASEALIEAGENPAAAAGALAGWLIVRRRRR